MVSIYVCGEDKTRQISDWVIKNDKSEGLSLTCHFPSGKHFFARSLTARSILPESCKTLFFEERAAQC